jgi:hypothetical protein
MNGVEAAILILIIVSMGMLTHEILRISLRRYFIAWLTCLNQLIRIIPLHTWLVEQVFICAAKHSVL